MISEVHFLAAAALLFLFGLLWPEKLMWIRWLTRIVGVLGALFVVMVLWWLWAIGRQPMLEGQPVDRIVYTFSATLVLFIFWAPGIGLWLGRKAGRFIRTFAVNVQETNL